MVCLQNFSQDKCNNVYKTKLQYLLMYLYSLHVFVSKEMHNVCICDFSHVLVNLNGGGLDTWSAGQFHGQKSKSS